jgi:tetratricopeptide (TPR) repeat protein
MISRTRSTGSWPDSASDREAVSAAASGAASPVDARAIWIASLALVLCADWTLTPWTGEAALRSPRPPGVAAPRVDDFDTLRRRADEARTAGNVGEAIELYRAAIALQPSWSEGHWYLGTIYYDADRHRECRDAFATVVRLEPEHGAAWAFRGLCEFKLTEYAPALEHLTRANDLGVGEDASFLAVVGYHRAILLARFEQFERALDLHAGFVRGGNTSATIVEGLGITLLRLPMLPSEVPPEKREMVEMAGRAGLYAIGMMRDAADRTFQQLISKYPDAPNVHYVYGTYLMGDRPAEALEQFNIELQRSPEHVLARVQIAQELIKQGEFDRASPYATDAARLGPNNFMARRVLGQLKLQAGDASGAIAHLEAARALEPTSPSVRYHLARAYQRAGRGDDAKRERAEFSRLESIQQRKRGGANTLGEEPAEDTGRERPR